MYRLRIATGPRSGECFVLPETATEPVRVGRGHDVSVRIPEDATLSRIHAELHLEAGGWVLHNKSQHGTHVGRRRVDDRRLLSPGDVLTFGETQVMFERTHSTARFASDDDPLTPATPTIAVASDAAGFDKDGVFHMGHTVLGVGADDIEGSFIWFGRTHRYKGLKVKTRSLYFLLVVAVLGLAGCLSMAMFIVLPTLLQHPQGAGLLLKATAFALIPAVPYVFLIKLLDRNDQIPWKNYLACLAWGGTVGCGFSLVLNAIGGDWVTRMIGSGSPDQAFGYTAVFVAPIVEECVKGLAVLFVFWLLHDEFDNVLEGMVLGAASGLGFALVENAVYNMHFLKEGATTLLAMGTYRALVNALIGHPVYTAMTGAGLGLLRESPRGGRTRLLLPVAGLILAIGLHLVWNGAAVFLGKALGPESTPTVLALNAVIFGGAGLLFFIAAYLFAQGRERRVLLTYLAEEVEKGFVQKEELESFRLLFGRQRYELAGLFSGGVVTYRLRRALRRAQVELAFRKWHLAQGDAPRGQLVDAYVLSARTRIRDARNRLRDLERKATLAPASSDEPPTIQPGVDAPVPPPPR